MIDTDVIQSTIDRGAHKVLVVDDTAATRYSTARVLRAAGFHVVEAASGLEALERSAEGVSAVVLDVRLPDMDGFEVCKRLRAKGFTELLPIVHLSATHVRSEDRVAGLNAGADAYMIHPVEPAVLVGTIQALIRARTAETQLRRSELRFRAIYDQAPMGISLLDAQGRFEEANPSMQRLLGYTSDELSGRALDELTADDAAREVVASLTRSRDTWQGELALLRRDGRALHLEWSVSAPMEGGLRIAIANDATERHELAARRAELLDREQSARSMAERHSRTKDDFIAILSHELRNPLNSIAGWVAVLRHRITSPEADKGLQAIERNVKTQARIISDILDVSRINSGKLRLEREAVDPAEVVGAAMTSLDTPIREKSIVIEQDFAHGGRTAWVDASRFQQVSWNLLSNAIKFSQPGATVRVSLRHAGDRLRLAVQDWGQGIDPEFLPHMFDRFAQSDAPGNRVHGGLGLGLAIVKQLVELHGGTVSAFSEGKGFGTTMTVEIPAALPAGSGEASPSSAQGLPEAPESTPVQGRPLDKLNVLVVEDDPGAREMLEMVLSDRGASVRCAHDFESAVQAARSSWPDVVVSDIGLPGRDGYELVGALREMQPAEVLMPLTAVALTAFARPSDQEKARAAGFDAHVSKPLKPHALVTAILGAYGSGR